MTLGRHPAEQPTLGLKGPAIRGRWRCCHEAPALLGFPAVILVFAILGATHTGPINLWIGVSAGVLVVWVYLVAAGTLSAALPAPGHSPGAHGAHVPAGIPGDHDAHPETEDALWLALLRVPEEGTVIGELMRITRWKRRKLYRHLREHAEAGRAIQLGRGPWRS